MWGAKKVEGEEGEKGRSEENLKEWDSRDGGGTEMGARKDLS